MYCRRLKLSFCEVFESILRPFREVSNNILTLRHILSSLPIESGRRAPGLTFVLPAGNATVSGAVLLAWLF